MNLTEFPEQTIVIARNQSQYKPLPAFKFKDDPEGRTVCCWEISFKERIKLLFSGKIWHQILTFNGPLQHQLLSLEKPDMTK